MADDQKKKEESQFLKFIKKIINFFLGRKK